MEENNVNIPESLESGEAKKGLNMKVLIIGIPLFVIQLVAVYFITANILLSRFEGVTTKSGVDSTEVGALDEDSVKQQQNTAEFGKFIFLVEDLIINPANTDGKRLLLSSLGFDVPSEADHKKLQDKEILLKDAIISVMGSKEIQKLSNITYRDTLRIEITDKLKKIMPDVKVNTIYFSKYILQ
jgi:flagellar FliL protein